jgi:polysaccharide biosynthesis transport protein
VASPESSSTYGVESQSRDQVSLLSVLRRRALIIVAVTLLAGGAAGAFAYLSRDTYESTAKLLFRQTIGPELNAMGLLPGAPDADNLSQNNVQVVSSRSVAVATARALQQRGVDMSVDDVTEDVSVTSAKDTDVVEVTAEASSAQRAALVARTYSEIAADQASGAERAQAERALRSVRQQLSDLPSDQREGAEGTRLRTSLVRLRTLSDVGNGSPQIIQPAFVPTDDTSNPLQTILLGLLFGALLGIGLALIREQADRKLRRTEQVSAAFDAPVLTTVPRSRALKRHKPFADLPPEVAEAFRMLQMNLRFAQREPLRSVLVTSSRSGEGKTTVAWNLAAAAASGGLSVALIEADLRRPSLAERYGLDPEPGLAEVLQGEVSIASSLQPVPLAGGAMHLAQPLHVLVAGRPAPNPWALMQSSVMTSVFDELRQDNELVVIDTSPIPHVADAIALMQHVDGVIVTASVNATSGPEATRLRDQLEALGANVLGVVANGGSAAAGYAGYARAPAGAQTNGRMGGNGHPDLADESHDPAGRPPLH